MVDKLLGRQLYDAGWKQGSLLPALPWSVIYDSEEPLTAIAKADYQKFIYESRKKSDSISTVVSVPQYRVASGITRDKDFLVVISQDCDIVKPPTAIPTIFAMRAFATANDKTLKPAASNSTRYFLLDESRGLVADSTIIVPIEKPVLLQFTPQSGILDNTIRRQFARWVAHGFNRPAFPDEVVEAVISPILVNMRSMQENGDPILDALDMVHEVRVAPLSGETPYSVSLLFIVPEKGLEDEGEALTRLVGRMKTWFDPEKAALSTWDALSLYQISAGDYADTQRIYLDHYTYQGRTIKGLMPPSFGL